jgi:hypothetical protein
MRNASGGAPTIRAAHPDADGGQGAKARLLPTLQLPRSFPFHQRSTRRRKLGESFAFRIEWF